MDTTAPIEPEEIDDPLPIEEEEEEEKYERILGIVGRFKHEQLEIEDFDLYQISSNSMDKLKVLKSVNF